MGLFDGFSLEEGEVRRNELQVACLERAQKAFGVFTHAARGVLFVTRRRVIFLDHDEKPLFETELRRLVAASVSPGSSSTCADVKSPSGPCGVRSVNGDS